MIGTYSTYEDTSHVCGKVTVASLLREARNSLHRSSTPSLDAQVLLAEVLSVSRAWVIAHPGDAVPAAPAAQFLDLVGRRAAAEPIAYLVGHREWMDFDLVVTPDVLIPRPETEIVVDALLALPATEAARTLVDVGTGSGAIAIACAQRLPHARVVATDISAAALQVARQNVLYQALGDRVDLRQGHLLDAVTCEPDLIVANLPYLSDAMMQSVDRDVLFEPESALRGGPTGLELYEDMFAQMRDRQWQLPVVCEIDSRQTQLMRSLVQRYFPHAQVQTRQDLAGLDRVVIVEP